MEVLLDGSFMLHGLRNGIDFFSQLEEKGFTVTIPREVLQELKDVKLKSKSDNRRAIDSLFELIEKRKVKKVGIGSGKVDLQLIKLGKNGKYIATMDSAIRRSVPNRVVISSATKKISVERS